MFIHLSNIQQLFSDTDYDFYTNEETSCLTCWLPLKDAIQPYSPHLLYVTDSVDAICAVTPVNNMHFLLYTEHEVDLDKISTYLNQPTKLLHIKTSDKQLVHSTLQTYFDDFSGLGLFAETLLQILFFEGGIQSMLDKVYPAFENPIFVFDAGFHLIAATWEEAMKTETGKNLIERGGFGDSDFQMVNRRNHIHEKVKKSEAPLIVHHPELGFDQMLCAIDTEKDFGHIVINRVHRDFCDMDKRLLILLREAINQQLKKDEFVRNNRGFQYEYFFRDLLDGKIATSKNHLMHLDYVESEFIGNLYCIVIETAHSVDTLNTNHIRSLFEIQFPSARTLTYNGEILIILCPGKNTMLSTTDIAAATKICQDQNLFAGMSNCFANILELPDYYTQALRAIELGIEGGNKPDLFIYENYYLDHISNIFAQKESTNIFCHTKLKILMDYDAKHDSELAETLYQYLINERNLAATSAAMDLHRNTLSYRLKKINSLVSIDYENYQERHYIILSYEMQR